MEYYWLFIFFLFGITFGSFFNVVGLRTPKNITFVNDHSHCPHCQHRLGWYELVPVLSFLWQRGKCHHCKAPISVLYPIIECLTGVLFAYSYWQIGFTLELVTAILFLSMLVIIFVTDIRYMIIPNKILLFFLPLLAIGRIVSPLEPWYDAIIGAVVGYLLIAAIILISNGGMGAGDMKLFFLLGIVLGWKNVLLTLFVAAMIGAIVGYTLRLAKKINPKQAIPFGPYIVIAAIISYFYGEKVISLYIGLL